MELHAVFTDTGYHRIAGVSSNHRWEPSACTGESVSVISSHYVRRGKRAPIVHGCESELRGEISQVEPLYSEEFHAQIHRTNSRHIAIRLRIRVAVMQIGPCYNGKKQELNSGWRMNVTTR